MQESESVLVQSKLPCEDCGSSDALALYSDGHTHCYSCEKTKQGKDGGTHTPRPKQAAGLIRWGEANGRYQALNLT